MSFRNQHSHRVAVRAFFRWLTRQNFLLYNPASDIDLSPLEHRLPRAVLTAHEAESVLAQPNIDDALGLRDSAVLETFYSTGMRRSEVIHLSLYDLDQERSTLMIRQGNGKKDRMVPIGERALLWIGKYLREARASIVLTPDDGTLFLTHTGAPFSTALEPDRTRLRGQGRHGKARKLPSLSPHHGDAEARRRRRHPLHSSDARPRRAVHDRDLHLRLNPQAARESCRHASRRVARPEGGHCQDG